MAKKDETNFSRRLMYNNYGITNYVKRKLPPNYCKSTESCRNTDHAQIILQMRSQCHLTCHLLLLSRQTTTQTFFWRSIYVLNFLRKEGNLICRKSSASKTILHMKVVEWSARLARKRVFRVRRLLAPLSMIHILLR